MPAVATTGALAGLEPAALWAYFGDICALPRPSKHEERVLEYLRTFAEERKLKWRQDSVGNIVIKRPGSNGGENAAPVVIQGHVDMVCEKNQDTVHDFMKDGIRLVRNPGDDWLKADGTTLGADNGIGVATALALLDLPPSVKLPPLECLFTVDEETGLTGAYGIAADLLEGRTMLNLDTEEWTEICIGCAGGGDIRIDLDVALEPAPEGTTAHLVTVDGLMGGHSGINIHEDRANAVQLAARVAAALLSQLGPGARLVQLAGGDKRNAIAREATLVVLVPTGQEAAAAKVVAGKRAELVSEYGALEKSLDVRLSPAAPPTAGTGGADASSCLAPADARRLLQLVDGLPHGALKHSHAIAGLVETSNNVASVHRATTSASVATYTVVTSTRSSIMSALEAVRDRIQNISELCGARVDRGQAYPGWQPNPQSAVLQLTKEVYCNLLGGGKEPKVGAIHAGLECGILGEKFPGMDMVSYGPTIRGAHSPDERVLISTVKPFWELTLGVLDRLADQKR